jgi:hypothetical protein
MRSVHSVLLVQVLCEPERMRHLDEAQWSLLVAADLINADRISWDNYNEANDLSVRAEQCQEEHGCCPARICAAAIYMTVGNKKFCKDHGIRLSGRARKKETAGIDGQTVEQ